MEVPKPVEDAAYVALGFGLLAWQKVQVRRREIERFLAGRCAAPGTGSRRVGPD